MLRVISSLRGLVRPGNSGGPIVDGAGAVIGTVFASMTDAPAGQPAGFAVPNSVLARALARASEASVPVSTGHCAQ